MKSLIIATMLMLSVNVGAQPSIDTLSVAAPTDTAQTTKENKLVIDLDFLTRGELRKGGLSNEEGADDQATFVIARTLLGIGYQRPGLIAHATAQHSGVWGSNETNSFNIYEAWVDLNTKNGFFAKVGRQSLSYDDQRIFGSDDWAMTAMSHDALKLGYEGHGHKLHVIGAFNQNIANIDGGGTYFTGGLQPYKAMETVWYHYDVKKIPLGISLLFTNIGMQSDKERKDTCTYQQQLFGTYIDYHTKKLTAEAAFYYQTGKEEHGIPIDAWMASGKVTYKHNDDLTLYGGYDYLSGDKNFAVPAKGQMGMPQHKKVKGFSSIYGSHHKFYGAMDFFYLSNYYGGFTPGLQNIYLGTKYSPVKKLSIDLSYHYLLTATQLNNDVNKSLGHEVEAAVTYQLMKDASLSAGYSFMRGTDTMVALKRTNNNRQLQWAWIMLSVSPKLLSTIW